MPELTAIDLLAIPKDRPEKLFTGDLEKDRAFYRTLQSRWHPDRPHGAGVVLRRIGAL
jgi:hypothetical protein